MRAFIIFCLLFGAAIAVPLEITTGKYCLLCRQIINGLEEFTKMSKETIEEIILYRCQQRENNSLVCKFLVEALDKIIEFIENNVKPREACVRLRMCPKQ
ncbi:unnamed protein product [Dracunculus medinensis]|uniref:Saposin B-type domain-containing protein n=1 Tax=Dracunculus medinensis TaxID=318479 RepID=A0A0N4UGP2_DRAME|nr:unnamed protein product [Dracunculus medinensis]